MQCLHVRQAVSAGLLNFVFKRNLSILSMCYINSKKKKNFVQGCFTDIRVTV